MDGESDNQTTRKEGSERPFIDAAWAEYEAVASRKRSTVGDSLRSFSLPGYRILHEIHRGGQGVVYQAMQDSTHRKVAIKVLKGGPLADHSDLARFEREVEVLGRLRHPHIVAIHDRGSAAGHNYLVMDYIPGRPLDAYVAGEALPAREILNLCLQVCEAVNAAHLRGIIHRDLKPSNIRVDDEGKPHVLDFGLAKLTQEGKSGAVAMTITGQFVGSLPWASPEQAAGRSEHLDIRSDVYSLGVILYQLLTKRFPYPVAGRMDDVVRHILDTPAARPSAWNSALDSDVDVLVLKCLAKDPERRYQSAGELARDIRRYLDGEAIEARPATSLYQFRQFARRNRALVGSVLAILVILTGATVVSVAFAVREADARQRERHALEREVQQRERADREAEQAQEIADFQAKMLGDIDPQIMGIQLRADLLSKAKSSWWSSAKSDGDADLRAAELERLIAGIDMTGLALTSLNENIFQKAYQTIDEQFASDPLIKAKLMQTLAITLRELGLLEEAFVPQTTALTIRQRELGDEHPDTLISLDELGSLQMDKGEFNKAEDCYRKVLDSRRRILGEDQPETLSSINNLAVVLRKSGKLQEAEVLYLDVLARRRELLGEEHPDTLNSLSNLGKLRQTQGRLSEAEACFREAVDKYRNVRGPEDLMYIESLSSLGDLLVVADKLAEAESVYLEVLEKRSRILGGEHPKTLAAMSKMSTLLQAQGKIKEAEESFRVALDKMRRVLGENHPDTLSTLSNLGHLLWAEERLSEAEECFRDVLDRRRFDEDHPSTLISLNNMGSLLRAQGKFVEGEAYHRKALEKQRIVLGNDHPHTLVSVNNVAVVLYEQAKFTEAEPYCREAMEKRRAILGEDHLATINSIGNMGTLLKAQGRWAEAEPFQREVFERFLQKFGPDHPRTVGALLNVSTNLRNQGKAEEAVTLLLSQEPAIRVTASQDRSQLLGRVMVALGRARTETRDFEAAEENLLEAVSILDKSQNTPGRDQKDAWTGLVELYEAWDAGDPKGAHAAEVTRWRARLEAIEPQE